MTVSIQRLTTYQETQLALGNGMPVREALDQGAGPALNARYELAVAIMTGEYGDA